MTPDEIICVSSLMFMCSWGIMFAILTSVRVCTAQPRVQIIAQKNTQLFGSSSDSSDESSADDDHLDRSLEHDHLDRSLEHDHLDRSLEHDDDSADEIICGIINKYEKILDAIEDGTYSAKSLVILAAATEEMTRVAHERIKMTEIR